MTNTPTKNIEKTVKQIKDLEKAGCEIIRVAVPDIASSQVLGEIKKDVGKKIGKVKIRKAGDIAPGKWRWLAEFLVK